MVWSWGEAWGFLKVYVLPFTESFVIFTSWENSNTMISLVLIYFIGKAFYNLAEKHNKSAWGFAVLGVLSYYGGIIIGGLIILVLYEVVLLKSFADVDSLLVDIISIPIGILVCWLFYLIIEYSWTKKRLDPHSSEDILDAELIQTNELGNVDRGKES